MNKLFALPSCELGIQRSEKKAVSNGEGSSYAGEMREPNRSIFTSDFRKI